MEDTGGTGPGGIPAVDRCLRDVCPAVPLDQLVLGEHPVGAGGGSAGEGVLLVVEIRRPPAGGPLWVPVTHAPLAARPAGDGAEPPQQEVQPPLEDTPPPSALPVPPRRWRRRPGRSRRLPARAAVALVAAAVAVALLHDGGGMVGRTAGTSAAIAGSSPPAPDRAAEERRRRLDACVPTDVAGQAGAVMMVGLSGALEPSHPLVARLAAARVRGVVLNDTNVRSRAQVAALVAGLRSRLGPDLVVALDEEGGRVTSVARLRATGPSARRLGTRPPAEIDAAGRRLGKLLSDLDFDLVLGPVADLDAGPARGVIGDRSFGADPDRAGEAARRFAAAVRLEGVGSTAKHFPGHAGGQDSHLGPARSRIARTRLLDVNVAAFRPLLADGVEAVMIGHVTYDALGPLPASLNPAAYELLRSEGFTGPAMTDALGMGAINRLWDFDRASVAALAAGADILLANQGTETPKMHSAIVAAVADGTLPAARLREAAVRAATLRPGCEQAARVLLPTPGAEARRQ